MAIELDVTKVRNCDDCIHRRVCGKIVHDRHFVVGCRDFLEEVVCRAEDGLSRLQMTQIELDEEIVERHLKDQVLEELAEQIKSSDAVRIKRSRPNGGLGLTATCHLVIYEKEYPSRRQDHSVEWRT